MKTAPLGSLSNNDGDGCESVVLKVNFRYFQLYRAYSISFSLSNVCRNWILIDCIDVQEKKKRVVVLWLRPPQNVKLGIFTSQSYKKALCVLLFCQSKPIAFCRSCWLHHSRWLSSMLYFTLGLNLVKNVEMAEDTTGSFLHRRENGRNSI